MYFCPKSNGLLQTGYTILDISQLTYEHSLTIVLSVFMLSFIFVWQFTVATVTSIYCLS